MPTLNTSLQESRRPRPVRELRFSRSPQRLLMNEFAIGLMLLGGGTTEMPRRAARALL